MENLTARQIATAVGAIFLTLVIAAGGVLRRDTQANLEIQDLVQIADQLRTAYAPQAYAYGTAAISLGFLANGNKVDPKIINGTNITTRWGNAITAKGATTNFVLTVPGLTLAQCTTIFITDQFSPQGVQIGITGGTPAPVTLPGGNTTAAATTACTAASNSLDITFNGQPS